MQGKRFVLVMPLLAFVALTSAGCSTSGSGGGGQGQNATSVTFTVTGNAPSGVDITYGSDGSNYQGPKRLPMTKTLQVNKSALYYDVTAQLSGGGGGDVTCKVQIGDAVKTGHASGGYGYDICSALLNSDPVNGGWS